MTFDLAPLVDARTIEREDGSAAAAALIASPPSEGGSPLQHVVLDALHEAKGEGLDLPRFVTITFRRGCPGPCAEAALELRSGEATIYVRTHNRRWSIARSVRHESAHLHMNRRGVSQRIRLSEEERRACDYADHLIDLAGLEAP